MELLGRARGKVLESRARAILDMDELQHLAGPARTWVSREDWERVWGHGRGWAPGWESPKQALMRFNRVLEELVGLRVAIETTDGEHRIHVATAELRELVALERRRARIVDECARAKREGRAPDLAWLDADPDQVAIADDYRSGKRPQDALLRKYGVGRDRLRKILQSQRVQIRAKRRMRISERIGPERTERALKLRDDGGSLGDVASFLGTTKWGAHRFLVRHGRDTKPANAQRTPPAQPPRSPGCEDSGACERWATCA